MYVSASGARYASLAVDAYAVGAAWSGAMAVPGRFTGVNGTATRPANSVRAVRETSDMVSLLAGNESVKSTNVSSISA